MDQIMDAKDTMGVAEMKMDLMAYLHTLHGKTRRISELILISGKSDSEIAEMMQVSRQYINRIKNELKNKLIT
ncbi:MAG: hypothetical protein PHS82_08800 [Lachnospiraceae bacterium]|nr:hypothetical protein [Lachnospiraceae bacterium]